MIQIILIKKVKKLKPKEEKEIQEEEVEKYDRRKKETQFENLTLPIIILEVDLS